MAIAKKCLGFAAALAMALLVIFALGAPKVSAAPKFEEAIITGDEVNMRLRPTKDSPVVLKFDKSTRVGVICEENGWYRIIYGNYRGYVNEKYVFLSSTDSIIGHVLSDGTKVYSSASEYGAEVESLSAGEAVTISGFSGDYYKVKCADEKEGYLPEDAIKTSTSKNAVTLLKNGMEGANVTKLQQALRKRGFLSASATGYFGDKTKDALMAFQERAGLSGDGVAGETTLKMLYDDSNNIKITQAEKLGISNKVQLSEWNKIKNIFERYSYAKVTDVATGISYRVYRFGGWYHADCVPASKEDTAKMKKANGGSWGWNRRAIWVTVDGQTFAASQNNQPHMVDADKNDNFKGHFCIHFYKSKVHENSKECPRHQAAVMKAYNKGQEI